jgi:ribonuclease HI
MFPNKTIEIPLTKEVALTKGSVALIKSSKKYTTNSPTNKSPTNKDNKQSVKEEEEEEEEMYAKIYPKCEYVLHFDGCSKGNPGPSGIGAVISKLDIEEWCGWQYIGKKTNNQSEYSALILGLNEAISRNIKELQVYGDSLLVINQVTGQFKVNNILLKELHQEVIKLTKNFDYIAFNHVYRDKNKRADELSNLGLDIEE